MSKNANEENREDSRRMKTDECLFKNVIMNVPMKKKHKYIKRVAVATKSLKILEVIGLAFCTETDRNLYSDTLPQIKKSPWPCKKLPNMLGKQIVGKQINAGKFSYRPILKGSYKGFGIYIL